MVVEVVVVAPVVLAIAAIACSLLMYMGDCAAFDRAAAQAVRVHGVSPGYGSYSASSCEAAVKEAIEDALGLGDHASVSVDSIDIGALSGSEISGEGLLYSFVPSYRKYICTLSYSSSIFGEGVFGISFPTAEHSCELVVDPFDGSGWS